MLGIVLTPLASRHDPASGGRRTNPRVVSWWHRVLARIIGVRLTTAGPRPVAPALLVANHVSWLDIILLGGATNTAFLSKDEVRRWPLIGWLAATAGTLFIRRGRGEARDIGAIIARQLQNDRLLTLFPEGTTSDGRDVRPFFSRLFAAAIDSGTDVVPVAIRYHRAGEHDPVAPYIDDQSLLDNLGRVLRRPQTCCHIVFGDPIPVGETRRKQLSDQARSFIRNQIATPAEDRC